ncbi:MAG: 2-hydroxyacid dehydrogenase [Candidatus Thorarchaeota archaeon]
MIREKYAMKILIPSPDVERIEAMRRLLGPDFEVVQYRGTLDDMLEKGSDADVLVAMRVPPEYIRAAQNLRLIQSAGTGIDRIDLDAVRERGDVIVCNTHVHAAEVAECAIALLLAAAKNIIISDRELRKGDWVHAFGGPNPNTELRNKTCLMIGLGYIGSEISRRLKGFDLRITAATRSGKSSNNGLAEELVNIGSVKPLVEAADFVILALPLTKESHCLVDKEFISWMKPSAILVNISRGHVVDEEALYSALKERSIRAAALDVWWNYPPKWGDSGQYPSESFPFHELDNIVISPHRAGFSEGTQDNAWRFIAENILRFSRGEEPQNIVDLQIGY